MQLVSPTLIHWIVIYPVDSAIQLLNNWGQGSNQLSYQVNWELVICDFLYIVNTWNNNIIIINYFVVFTVMVIIVVYYIPRTLEQIQTFWWASPRVHLVSGQTRGEFELWSTLVLVWSVLKIRYFLRNHINNHIVILNIIYQGITFEHAKEVRKTNLNPALFTYYKNPVFISKVRLLTSSPVHNC